MLELENVHVSLISRAGPVNILRGASLAAAAGESVAVTGRSGAGKTTLMMAAAGLLRPDQGVVRVAGTQLNGLNEDELARFRRRHVGVVFQSFHLLPNLTARENAALPLELAGREGALELADAALEQVGLGARASHYPGELSGGEQQRVAIARAFVARPSLILADEPTGNLDAATGDAVIEVLFDLCREQNACLLLITHDAGIAARCARTVRLKGGMVVEG